jgi:uncharacterized protein (UPF0333 family)
MKFIKEYLLDFLIVLLFLIIIFFCGVEIIREPNFDMNYSNRFEFKNV